MALKATVYKAALQISDIDRGYYAEHNLTLAQHPSETDQRLMVRLFAFALAAHERLQFGRGVSCDDEPDLWRHALSGEIEQWIELGQPDETRVRRACARASEVWVIGYQPRSFAPWWQKQADALARHSGLRVLELDDDAVDQLSALLSRNLRLQVLIQDGEVQLLGEQAEARILPIERKAMGTR